MLLSQVSHYQLQFMRVQQFLTAQSILYIGSGTMSTCHCALFFMFWLLADNRCFHVWRSVTVSRLRKFNWNNSDFITPTVSCWSGSRNCAATGTLCKKSIQALLARAWPFGMSLRRGRKVFESTKTRFECRGLRRSSSTSKHRCANLKVAERSLKTRRAPPSRDHTVQQCTQSGHRVSVAVHAHCFSVVCTINTSSSTVPCNRFWTIVSGRARPQPCLLFFRNLGRNF